MRAQHVWQILRARVEHLNHQTQIKGLNHAAMGIVSVPTNQNVKKTNQHLLNVRLGNIYQQAKKNAHNVHLVFIVRGERVRILKQLILVLQSAHLVRYQTAIKQIAKMRHQMQ